MNFLLILVMLDMKFRDKLTKIDMGISKVQTLNKKSTKLKTDVCNLIIG